MKYAINASSLANPTHACSHLPCNFWSSYSSLIDRQSEDLHAREVVIREVVKIDLELTNFKILILKKIKNLLGWIFGVGMYIDSFHDIVECGWAKLGL